MNPNIQNIRELKQWLKEKAAQIRKTRAEFKEHQRKHNGSGGSLHYAMARLSYEYRHHHIAYCELRGRDRSVIEQPKEGNKPNESYIRKIKDGIEEAMAKAKEAEAQAVA